jgi:hypothetical protein
MRELGMTTMHLARETRLSPTTIRYMGRPGRGHSESALVAISAVLRWRYDHLSNVLHGQPGNNTTAPPGTSIGLLLRAELAPVKDDVSRLGQAVREIADKIESMQAGLRRDQPDLPRPATPPTAPICALPVPDDMDADYSPQYVKLVS